MITNNPFEGNNNEINTGFYFDKNKSCICFLFNDEGDESSFPSTKIYNRFTKPRPSNLPSFIIMRDSNDSNINDLVDLDINLFTDKESLLKDFKWLLNNPNVSETFVQFLLEEEKYLILELFKTVSKIESAENGRNKRNS